MASDGIKWRGTPEFAKFTRKTCLNFCKKQECSLRDCRRWTLGIRM